MSIVYLTEHFSQAELQCKCGACDYPGMDGDFMEKLEILRTAYGRAMSVSSAYRCPTYNDKVSGTGRAGPHTTRRAIDIRCSAHDSHAILKLALAGGFSGIGVSQKGNHGARFLHLDTLSGSNRPWVWSY